MAATSDEEETALQCAMVNSHHPDCECQLCKDHKDPVCGKPAIGFLMDLELFRVCAECAKMAAEDPEAYGALTYYKDRVTGQARDLA